MTGIFLLIYKKNLCSTAISSDLSLVFLLVSYFVFQVKMTSSFAFMTKTYLMINIFHLWLFSAPNHPGKSLHPWTMWEKSALNHPDKPLHPPPLFGQTPFGNNTFQKGISLKDIIICNPPGIIFKIFLDMHITEV